MSIFELIAQKHHWDLKGDPVRLNGGFMHKMYKVNTKQGTYALKLLNPFVMQRKTALENFTHAEQIERLLEQEGIPILPALSFDGRKMQEIDGNYYYIFDYFSGKALKVGEITDYNCTEMGKILAKIHNIDKKYESRSCCDMSIDWEFYLTGLKKVDIRLHELLNDAFPIIESSQIKGNLSRKKLPPVVSICHNDMDCKNILWSGKDYRIIDLECLSYNNPFMELFEMALCWRDMSSAKLTFSCFNLFCRDIKTRAVKCP